jgi:menaquinone-9 beta-reductase
MSQDTSTFDVIIVGGGPGGSTAGWRLALAGLRVLILDAASFPRLKICAGWVTRQALADLELDPNTYPQTIKPFDACILEYQGARYETAWKTPASYGIIRREFDHHLLERARAAGADVRWGIRVTEVEQRSDGVTIRTKGGCFEAPLVIGAGGHRCPVAKALGEVSEAEEVVTAQESETRLSPEWVERLGPLMSAPELYLEPDLRGYSWYFPKQDFLNIGVGCTDADDGSLPKRREALIESLRASGRLPADMPIEPFKGHAYVVRRHAPRRLAGARFMLVGDAAGLARDLSGEGIGPAIRSGILAADAARAFVKQSVPLDGYRREIETLYGRGELGWMDRQIERMMPTAAARFVVRVVLGMGMARRRLIFDGLFGMKGAESPRSGSRNLRLPA